MKRYTGHIIWGVISILCVLHCMLSVTSCANRGIGPQGGPKDSIPPVVLKEVPLNGSIGYKESCVEITFNEYIQLDNVVENVLISPPQQKPPVVKAVGKRLLVSFEEPLKDSTTYTIDLGRAVCDYNEKNPMEHYCFSFSTGDCLDSLQIRGRVVNAEDLNPVSGVSVGIHSSLSDTALSTIPFVRLAKTDSKGEFFIQNVHPGQYRIYALQDISRDYVYQPGECLAFSDSIIVPEVLHEETDSTISIYYAPADVLLWYFSENKQRHYFQRVLREEPHMAQLLFSAPQTKMPVIRSLRPSEVDSTKSDSAWVDWSQFALWSHTSHYDTLWCYLTDSAAMLQDTLLMEMTYMVSDSVYNLVERTDTLRAIYRAPRLSERALEAKRREAANRRLRLSSNAKNKFEIYDTLTFHADYPIAQITDSLIHLLHRVDTGWVELTTQRQVADSAGMTYQLVAPLEAGGQYELRMDSAAVHDIYGVTCDKQRFSLQVKTLEDYSTLLLKVSPFDSRIRVQLLDEKEHVVREQSATEQGIRMEYLTPRSYYMRLYIDENGDGQWTSGDWMQHRQPEPVYYYYGKLSLRANWDFEETFNYLEKPQLESKPQELVKEKSTKKQ